jgi:O-antigen ligase
MMEPEVEYFYGETLRWSFGFENPNKAAVLFACAVPLCWWLWQAAWRLERRCLKVPALLLTAVSLLAAWVSLIMTFSRGGLVAALVGLSYLIGWRVWQNRTSIVGWQRRAEIWLSGGLLVILLASTLWNGLASRSATAVGKDASVGNRFELWAGALQMAVEQPRGFGEGQSGNQYMQWYQAIDHQAKYRTMVNSYLTVLVERGWLWAAWIAIAFAGFWNWTRASDGSTLTMALRAAILAFLVAGIFSTTMEDWRLWLLPIACALTLTVRAYLKKQHFAWRKLALLLSGLALLAGGLFGLGMVKSQRDPLHREFNSSGLTALAPRQPIHKMTALGCVIDTKILGTGYSKLLRELALRANLKILIGKQFAPAGVILYVGTGSHECLEFPNKPAILLAPETFTAEEAAIFSTRTAVTQIIIPEIDEDGRVAFWQDFIAAQKSSAFSLTQLTGVGNRIDWAWPEVIETLKDL